MSGVVSIGAAVTATAIAGFAVAEVGLTIGTAFAIAGAVGATAAAVGTIAKVPELQYAGAALGIVGAVGGIASAAGVFGAGAFGELGGAALGEVATATTAAETMSPFASSTLAATDAGTWAGVAAEVGASYADVGSLMEGQGIVAGEMPGYDVVDMVNSGVRVPTGQVQTPTGLPEVTPAAAEVPTVTGTPAQTVPQQQLPDFKAVPEFDLPMPGETPLLNQTVPQGGDAFNAPWEATAPGRPGVETPLLDQQPIPQGDALPPQGDVPSAAAQQQPAGRITLDAGSNRVIEAAQRIGPGYHQYGAPPAPAEPSTFGKIMDYVGKHPVLLMGAIQAGSSFLSGAFGSSITPEQRAALEAQAEQNRAAARLYDQQTATLQWRQQNMSQMPIARRGGISPGLLNSPVTGVPA